MSEEHHYKHQDNKIEEPLDSTAAPRAEEYVPAPETTYRGLIGGLFGFGGKKEQETKYEDAKIGDESENKFEVSEEKPEEKKHESLIEQFPRSDNIEETRDSTAPHKTEEYVAAPQETTDRGLFGFGGKKEEKNKYEEAKIGDEFENKVEVTEEKPEEQKHESLIEKFPRSDNIEEETYDTAAAPKAEEYVAAPPETTDRGLFGFGGKQEEKKNYEEGKMGDEFENKVEVYEERPEEKKHESLIEKFPRSDNIEETYDTSAAPKAEEYVAAPPETTDRGLFGFGGKKEEKNKYEEAKIGDEFENKIEVSEEQQEDKKHESLNEKFPRSDNIEEETYDTDAAPQAEYVEAPPETTDRGLFGFGGKKEEKKYEEAKIGDEFENKVDVYEEQPEEKKHESLIEKFQRSDNIEETSDSTAPPEYVAAPPETTDHGRFGIGGKKEEEKKYEEANVADGFENKVEVFEEKSEEQKEEEKKHESLIEKFQRSNISNSSSGEEEEVGEDGEKKKKKKKVEKKEEAIEKCEDTTTETEEPEAKKGLLDKIKKKIHGSKKTEEDATSPPLTPSEEVEGKEKKGLLEKIKNKIPGYHSKTEEEKEQKEKEKEGATY